jgi:lipooligosaccharide transport system permease protein
MTSTTISRAAPNRMRDSWKWRRAAVLIERNMMIYRRSITPLAFGLVEPIMYLLTIGFGVGTLVGTVPGVDVRYPAYVAPAILATTAMNTAFSQTCFAVFSRIKIEGTYLAIVPTPLSPADIAIGEIASALLNGLLTSIGFLAAAAIFGLIVSPGILLAIVSAAVVGYAFAAGGLAVTTYVRDFPDFQLVQLFMLPMYLFATTFYPLSTYPRWLQPIIEALPLYQSIVLVRDPALGDWHAGPILFAAAYLLCFGATGTAIATRRLGRKLHV